MTWRRTDIYGIRPAKVSRRKVGSTLGPSDETKTKKWTSEYQSLVQETKGAPTMKNSHRENCTKRVTELQAEIQWLDELESKLVGISTTRYIQYKAFQNVHEALCEARLEYRELNKPRLMKRLGKVVKL